MKLNLGCSDNLHPDYLSVDIWAPPSAKPARMKGDIEVVDGKPTIFEGESEWAGRFMKADLRKAWPFETSSVDDILANDIFEHLPSKVKTMNEAHRVLKPGGLLELFVPTTDGRGAWQDPTHVSYWTPNDLFYFTEHFAEWKRFHEAYGITARFALMGPDPSILTNPNLCVEYIERCHKQYASKVWKLQVVLEAVK